MRPSYRIARERRLRRIIERDGDRCFYCHCQFGTGKRAATIDHFMPRSAGGTNEVANLRAACFRCNGRKRSRTGETFLNSVFIARRWRIVAAQEAIAARAVAVKRQFHHPALTWHGEWRWVCVVCGQSGSTPTESPARTICAPPPFALAEMASPPVPTLWSMDAPSQEPSAAEAGT